nr:unnamed protein product [Digitaria exilis]
MSTKVMNLTIALFVVLNIMSTNIPSSEAGNCGSEGERSLPPIPLELLRCFSMRRNDKCTNDEICENFCEYLEYPEKDAHCRGTDVCCCVVEPTV